MHNEDSHSKANISRRGLMRGAAAAMVATGAANAVHAQLPQSAATADFKVKNGRIHQSVMGWCFKPMETLTLAKHCKEIGLVAIEGIPQEHYKACKELGLEISLVSSHGFVQGPCNPKFHDEVIAKLK